MSMLRSLKYVAAAYGSTYGVRVVPSNRAFTDGDTIHTIIDEKNPEATWGFLTHEAAHCRYTTFGIDFKQEFERLLIARPELEKAKFTMGHLFSLYNGLEDNRIEYRFFHEYPGAFNTFDSMNELLIKQGLWKHEPTDNLLNAITSFAGLFAAGNIAGMAYPSCKILSAEVNNHLQSFKDLDEHDYLEIKQIVLDSVRSNSSRDALELSMKLLCLMAKLKLDAESQGDSNQQGGDEKQGSGSDNQQSQGGSNQQGSDEKQGGGSDNQQSQGGQSNSGDKSFTANYDVNGISENKDKGELVGEFLSSSSTAENIDSSLEIAATDHQRSMPLTNQKVEERYEDGVSASGKLQRRIANLLKARARTHKDIYSSGRKLDRRKIATIKSGNSRVFSRKREGISGNTALYVTLDISGSMNSAMPSVNGDTPRIEVATRALSALAYAVSRQKTSTLAIGAYNNTPYDVCDFKQPVTMVKDKLNHLYASGGTSYVPTMLRGVLKLASQSDKTRKVLILVTDGQPGDREKSAEVIKQMRESNIEVYCIGVDLNVKTTEVVKNLFGDSCFISIKNAEELQDEILHLAHACM